MNAQTVEAWERGRRPAVRAGFGAAGLGVFWRVPAPSPRKVNGRVSLSDALAVTIAVSAYISGPWYVAVTGSRAQSHLKAEFSATNSYGLWSTEIPRQKASVSWLSLGVGRSFRAGSATGAVELGGGSQMLQTSLPNDGRRAFLDPAGYLALSVRPRAGRMAPASLNLRSHVARVDGELAVAFLPSKVNGFPSPSPFALRELERGKYWMHALEVSVGYRLQL